MLVASILILGYDDTASSKIELTFTKTSVFQLLS